MGVCSEGPLLTVCIAVIEAMCLLLGQCPRHPRVGGEFGGRSLASFCPPGVAYVRSLGLGSVMTGGRSCLRCIITLG